MINGSYDWIIKLKKLTLSIYIDYIFIKMIVLNFIYIYIYIYIYI